MKFKKSLKINSNNDLRKKKFYLAYLPIFSAYFGVLNGY